jgi:hypothetical protein
VLQRREVLDLGGRFFAVADLADACLAPAPAQGLSLSGTVRDPRVTSTDERGRYVFGDLDPA